MKRINALLMYTVIVFLLDSNSAFILLRWLVDAISECLWFGHLGQSVDNTFISGSAEIIGVPTLAVMVTMGSITISKHFSMLVFGSGK